MPYLASFCNAITCPIEISVVTTYPNYVTTYPIAIPVVTTVGILNLFPTNGCMAKISRHISTILRHNVWKVFFLIFPPSRPMLFLNRTWRNLINDLFVTTSPPLPYLNSVKFCKNGTVIALKNRSSMLLIFFKYLK